MHDSFIFICVSVVVAATNPFSRVITFRTTYHQDRYHKLSEDPRGHREEHEKDGRQHHVENCQAC